MPIHILSVVNVPRVIIDRINSILANFFQGEEEGKRKLHWRAWSKICKPTIEGEFFKAKYLRDGHLTMKVPVSHFWRFVVASVPEVMENVQDTDLLNELNLEPPRVAVRKCMLVGWIKPSCGLVKINCDGSARNNPGSSGGGGILRDANGYFKRAFTSHYGVGSNNRAELKALIDGIWLCKRLSYSYVIIESDSKIVVD
ncbi:hypothetical protein LWI28_014743 [Acer negundo]|uniref:RNase H type-1 domain-containing protein n=1 Tax=Acer negundo TaxID=4023 RepID=A0AAD5NY42_ACENE|nr:hypothetical protein LWI28_014743 [Acer negundo]